MVTILSAMMNSLWTMIILFCELCGCEKFCFKQDKDTHTKTIEVWYRKIWCQSSRNYGCCKRCLIIFGKMLLFGFIFLLFSGNFVLGLLTIGHITGSISLSSIGVPRSLFLRQFVTADGYGPGFDQKRDEAMFIYIPIELPQQYQVVLLNEESVVTRRSIWTNQIINRLYIGQFEELSHLKDGTLTKGIPCSRVFSFMNRVDESLFLWNEVSTYSSDIDFSNCKLIFNMRYYPSNNDWNPFEELFHVFKSDITIDWGIHIRNESICPLGMRPFDINEVLTKEVEDALIKYTCSSACGDDSNICDNADSARFQSRLYGYGNVQILTDLYFAINDLKVIDSCEFYTHFNLSSKFCNEYWADVEPVQVPIEIQHAYPQFITIPELYKLNEERDNWVPRYFCDQLWNNNQACCV